MQKFFSAVIMGAIILTAGFSSQAAEKTERAIFAGGCFWCMHAAFEQLDGVMKVKSGYTGGEFPNPTYKEVSGGETGHVEAIEVTYDSERLAYTKLLEWFWDNVDPTDPEGQFCDKGSQYLAGIFYTTDEQKKQAEESIDRVEKRLKQKIATFLRPAAAFYKAEEYHQSYYQKSAIRYKLYKAGCGRDQMLEKVWNRK